MASSRHRKRRLMETRAVRIALRLTTFLVVAFLWIPLLIIMLYAFNSSTIQSWPISSYTFHWFRDAWHDQDVRSALWLSLKVGLLATGIALVLGTAAAFAIHRFRFFGRESISFLLILPIALPGIITGMALNSFYTFSGVGFSIWTIVIGTRRSAWCSSTTTCLRACGGRRRRSWRPRWTSAPTAGRRSASSS